MSRTVTKTEVIEALIGAGAAPAPMQDAAADTGSRSLLDYVEALPSRSAAPGARTLKGEPA
jgi:hypothetical protein